MTEPLTRLHVQLHAPDSEIRLAAVAQLATLAAPAMELFALCLGDDDWRVRKAAIAAFLKSRYTRADIETLIDFLRHDENAGLRNAAIEILVGLGSEAVDPLRAKIGDADVDVRKFVIDILGEIGDARCGDELLEALDDKDPNVRYAAVETLGKLQITQAADRLLALLADSDPGLKFTLIQTLARLGQPVDLTPLLPLLEERLLRKALFECFGFIGDARAFAPLVEGLADPLRNQRETALLALHRLSQSLPEAFTHFLSQVNWHANRDFLLESLRSSQPEIQQAALGLFAFVGRYLPLDGLLSCLREEKTRASALEVFAQLGAQVYAGVLQDAALLEDWQLEILFVGGELGYPAAVPLAIKALGTSDPQLRYLAVRVLGQGGDRSHLPALLELLDDEIVPIRTAAVAALARLARCFQPDILPALELLINDPDADKRKRCMRILREMEGPQVQTMLLKACQDPSAEVRAEAVRALHGHVHDSVVAGLTLALTDESPEVRRLAVDALAECSSPQALAALKLVSPDEDIWVRAAVMRALAKFPADQPLLDLLTRALRDEAGLVVIAALESLMKLTGPSADAFLKEALLHRDEEVVKTALVLLRERRVQDALLPECASLLHHGSRDLRVLVADILGQSVDPTAFGLVEKRLEIETDPLVSQALEAASLKCKRRLAELDR